MEQKNWAVVRAVVGYHRYDTTGELLLLNKIWLLQGLLTNFFYPQQKLLSKQRQGAKVIKKYDVATTPYSRATGRKEVTAAAKERLVGIDAELNPAALQRQVQALSSELLNLTTSKAAKRPKPQAPAPAGPLKSDDRIEPTSRLTSSTGRWRADRVRGGPKIVCSGGETC